MDNGVFGRTNEVFPAKWLRLVTPDRCVADHAAIATSALNSSTVIDISASPALWGGFLRATPATLMGVGPFDLARAAGEQHAHDLVLAHLIETLSGIGRDNLDFYFLQIDRAVTESQLSGALIALEEARHEGNVKFVGLAARDAFAAQSVLHFHDAFEVLLASSAPEYSGIRALARSRRVAVVTDAPDLDFAPGAGDAALFAVGTTADIDRAMQFKAAVA